jgi:penicillin-binding protein 2
MSIGQGMLLVTPLQMAAVAAALANGGTRVRPYLHKKDGTGDAKIRARPAGPSVPFSPESIELVRKGMRDVVVRGTGRKIADGLPVTCAGKTGTAEIGRGETRRKNTWVIAFAPYEEPTVAMAMIVERGESGGKTVAPRVNAVLARMFGRTQEGGAP